ALRVKGQATEALEMIKRLGAAAALEMKQERLGDVDEMMKTLYAEVAYRDHAYTIARIGRVALYAAAIDRMVVLATSQERIEDLWDRHIDKDKLDTLAKSKRHEGSLYSTGGTRTTTMVVQVDTLLASAETVFGEEVAQVRQGMRAFGLDSLKTIALAAAVNGDGFGSRLSLLFDGERTGIAKLFGPAERPGFTALDFAPKNCIFASAGRFNPELLWDVFGSLPMAAQKTQNAERFIKAKLGIDLRADLLGQMGPEGGFVIGRNHGLIPDLGLICKVKDGERLERALVKIISSAPWPKGAGMKDASIGGVKAHVVPLWHPGNNGIPLTIPLAPTFGIVDGHLLITPFPLSFQRFVAVKQGRKPSLRANRDFGALRQRVPENALAVSYTDVKRLMATLYDTLMPIVQCMPQQAGATQVFELPEVDTLTQHLYGSISWRYADERGVHWQSHGALDTTTILIAQTAALGGVAAAFWAGRTPEIAPPVQVAVSDHANIAQQCEGNLQLMRILLRRYRREHGKLPDGLDEVKKSRGMLPPTIFSVPGTDKEYAYLGMDSEGAVLIHGFANGADGKISVLLKNLKCDRVTAQALEDLKARRRPRGQGQGPGRKPRR
ncbi:MAG: hypothetical protein V3T86_10135, partial [Planctomycetota bacterium]